MFCIPAWSRCAGCGVRGDDVTRQELLRQAQQGYEEIGAPAHARRLAHQIGG